MLEISPPPTHMGCGLYLISTWVPGRAWLFWVLAGCALQLGLCMFDGWPCRVVAGQLMVYVACFVEDAIAAYVPRFVQSFHHTLACSLSAGTFPLHVPLFPACAPSSPPLWFCLPGFFHVTSFFSQAGLLLSGDLLSCFDWLFRIPLRDSCPLSRDPHL